MFGSIDEKEGEDEQKKDCVQISEQERDDAYGRCDVPVDSLTPVTTAQTIRARQDFAKEYWKDLTQGRTSLFVSINSQNSVVMPRYSNGPASIVADDDSYRYLPQ